MSQLRALLVLFVFLTVLTGGVYPLAVTLVGHLVFARQASGSVIEKDGKTLGSDLLGQQFDKPTYFWGRPSATSPFPCDGASSTGSNLGPTNSDMLKNVRERVAAIRAAHPDRTGPVPADLVTASASGLDPHISPAAAEYQVNRVAQARSMSAEQVRLLVTAHTEGRTLGILGEPRVHVLRLNLALDDQARTASSNMK